MPFCCPVCDAKTRVMDTRAEVRRRKCLNPECNHLFYTEEIEYTPNPRDKNPTRVTRIRSP